MKKALLIPVVMAVLIPTGCSESSGPDSIARVRFFNAATAMTGSGGFTTNGQFSSALAFGQSACAAIEAGSASFAFGAATSGGTGLSGNAVATLNNQALTDGSTYTMVATGAGTSPSLFLLQDNFLGTLGASQAAVRFVNLAPGTGATANTYTVLTGTIGTGVTTLFATDIAVGAPTTFGTVSSGSNSFSILAPGHEIVISGGTAGTLDLSPGTINTIAIVPNTSSGTGYRLVNLPRCLPDAL